VLADPRAVPGGPGAAESERRPAGCGSVRGRLECPRRREGDGYRPIMAQEVPGLGRGQGLADLRPGGFETIVPDLAIGVEAGARTIC
jgi:hypothetical protein